MKNKTLLEVFKSYYKDTLPNGSESSAAKSGSAINSLFEHTLRTKPNKPNLNIYTLGRQTYIDLSCANMPFAIASLLNLLSSQSIYIYSQHNFIIGATYAKTKTKTGAGTKITAFNDDGKPLIVLRFIVEFLSTEEQQELSKAILNVCLQLSKVTNDWQAMNSQVSQVIRDYQDSRGGKSVTVQDARKLEFMSWITNNKCLFLGYSKYVASAASKRASPDKKANFLGLSNASLKLDELEDVMANIEPQEGIDFFKLPVLSPIHRRVYIHCISIGIRGPGKAAKIEEHRFLLLYSFDFFSCNVNEIPYIKDGFQRQLTRLNIQPNSYRWRVMRYALTSYPRDEILQIIESNKFNALTERMMEAFSSTSFRNMVYYDKRKLFVNSIILAPREDYNTEARRGFENILKERMNLVDGEFNVLFSEERLARVFLSFPLTATSPHDINTTHLEEEIAEFGTSWRYDLRRALLEKTGDELGISLYKNYAGIFGTSYCERFNGEQAAADLQKIIAIGSGQQKVDVCLIPEKQGDYYRLRLIGATADASLSNLVHILENAGATPITSRPYFFSPYASIDREVRLLEFNLTIKGNPDANNFKRSLEETLAAVYCGLTEDDGFNGLAISVSMASRDIMLLRAWSNYLTQVQTSFSRGYIEDTLCTYPHCARILVAMFKHRFLESGRNGSGRQLHKSNQSMKVLTEEFNSLLEDVPSLEQEHILRHIKEVIDAIVRSNFNLLDISIPNELESSSGNRADTITSARAKNIGRPASATSYITFKIQPSGLSFAEGKQPRTEIFVYSASFEGVHLRDGPLARGGIRWSDKRAGYRNEVYQLVKAQIIKNAIIVPTGAKGGFYIKNPAKNIREIYSVFIEALLGLTDTYSNGRLVNPKIGRIYDDADPYLVVAPDKGTADLSDLANEIAVQQNFWMGDAFASSGSSGYSHKDMGITARGAWEAVKRSFAELGIDADKDPIEVIGVGDMSGDVFGNGMLLSRNIRLVCAFNHRNIFIDPNPHPQKSYKERMRLFRQAGSTWQDYSKSALSPGGIIFSRTEKKLKLNQAIQDKFGIKKTSLSPDDLIKHILKSPADLLWFGGIGTYVKGNKESHADAKDIPNDNIRVDGKDLRVRVIGEGANLGASLQGRVEFDRAGGKVATDSNDNSGGVHCSDKEVNIKIMLSVLQESGKVSAAARTKLLKGMTNDVSEGVLAENISQNLALSMEKYEAEELFSRHWRLALFLDAATDLSISMEEAPTSLTRPQLSILFGMLKNKLKLELNKHSLVDDRHTLELLQDYFPPQLAKMAGTSIRKHFLTKEIINIQAINRMVDKLGLAFWGEVIEENTDKLPELVAVFLRLDEIFNFSSTTADLAAHPAHYPKRLKEILRIRDSFISMLNYVLADNFSSTQRMKILEELRSYVEAYKQSLKTTNKKQQLNAQVDLLLDGSKFLLAAIVSMHPTLKPVSASRKKQLVVELIEAIDQALSVASLMRGKITDVEYWQRKGREAISEDILLQRQRILESLLPACVKEKQVSAVIDKWQAKHKLTIASYQACIKEFTATQEIGSMAYLASMLRRL